MSPVVVGIIVALILIVTGVVLWVRFLKKQRDNKNYERALKMVPMLIHLPPATDDIQGGGRDERDVTNEALSQAQIMYSIIASTVTKGMKSKIYGQRHISFEIIAADDLIKYYAIVPAVLTETIRQAVASAYPTARLEEIEQDNIFSKEGGLAGVVGGELTMKKSFVYPIATYEEKKWDAASAVLNALSNTKKGEGLAIQIMFRPTDGGWVKSSHDFVQKIKDGKAGNASSNTNFFYSLKDIIKAPFEVPDDSNSPAQKPITNLQQAEIDAIEEKTKYPGFETLIRIVASSNNKPRSEALLGGVVSAFSQFNSSSLNSFQYDMLKDAEKISTDYILRIFPQGKRTMILNSVELATIFHLPSQNNIPTSQVERQLTKQVDGPARLATEGVLLGVNEFRGQKKQIHLTENDRRRHTYIIGATGMGKSVLLGNIAYQDMMAGRGFAFIDPHGDVVEDIMSKVPPERMDDVIYFDPGDMEHPIGMNMFEFDSPDQKDFIIQEGINMLYSLYDPGHTGIFGPRGEHMFRNAALLLMSDPEGATFIDIPRVFTDPEFVKQKLKYVTDKTVYDYWTKEFPASQKSNDSGEVTTWFVSKWGPFLSNTMMRNILGQTKSGFKLRDIMDNKKILLVNLSKGKMGEMNSKLLGMIFVMKFQTAAMSRVDTPEDQRNDFSLFVDEFQNFSTESFESILSEARKFRLNLVIANQFMTQLTDKIREGILGNVGTIIAGRVGITDAEMLEKAFVPVFGAEDLHNQPNHHAITTVMMFGMPSSPFTMNLCPPMGDRNEELLTQLKLYSATRHARTKAEVEAEIQRRLGAVDDKPKATTGNAFMDSWMEKKAGIAPSAAPKPADIPAAVNMAPKPVTAATVAPVAPQSNDYGGITPLVNDGPVFDDVVPDEEIEQLLGIKAEDAREPDVARNNEALRHLEEVEQASPEINMITPEAPHHGQLEDDQVIKLR